MNNPKPPENIALLAKKWQEGRITDEEKIEFDLWYNSNGGVLEIITKETRKQAESRIYQSILVRGEIRTHRQKRTIALQKWASAAAILLFALSGLLYYHFRENSLYANDIAPGTNGATLTLANGRKINISKMQSGQVASENGVSISKNSNGELVYAITAPPEGSPGNAYNTLQTLRGEHARVLLPDGTEVFLNASSSLTYPSSFAKLKERKVVLSGEGYFEVSRDSKHPFIVKTDLQTVRVLGTHFNINAYQDEDATKTTLLEGSVKLDRLAAPSSKSESIILKPSEQASLAKNGQVNVKQVDTEEAVAWKNNEFLFKTDNFRMVMRKIERWYDVEVVYEPSAPLYLQLGGYSSRARNISAILKMMEKTGEVHFRIEGRKVYVSK